MSFFNTLEVSLLSQGPKPTYVGPRKSCIIRYDDVVCGNPRSCSRGIPKRRIQGGTQSRVRRHDGRPRCRRPYAGARAHSLMVFARLAMQTRPPDRRSISQILICLASPKVLRRDPRMVWLFDLLSSPSARDSIIIVISLERQWPDCGR